MKNCAIAFFYYRAKSLAAEGIQYSSGIADIGLDGLVRPVTEERRPPLSPPTHHKTIDTQKHVKTIEETGGDIVAPDPDPSDSTCLKPDEFHNQPCSAIKPGTSAYNPDYFKESKTHDNQCGLENVGAELPYPGENAGKSLRDVCAVMDAEQFNPHAAGIVCAEVIVPFGWKFNGHTCVEVYGSDGCACCAGKDCNYLYYSREDCLSTISENCDFPAEDAKP